MKNEYEKYQTRFDKTLHCDSICPGMVFTIIHEIQGAKKIFY